MLTGQGRGREFFGAGPPRRLQFVSSMTGAWGEDNFTALGMSGSSLRTSSAVLPEASRKAHRLPPPAEEGEVGDTPPGPEKVARRRAPRVGQPLEARAGGLPARGALVDRLRSPPLMRLGPASARRARGPRANSTWG